MKRDCVSMDGERRRQAGAGVWRCKGKETDGMVVVVEYRYV